MARKAALNTDDVAIDQPKPIKTAEDRQTIVKADLSMVDKDYMKRLAMGQDWVLMKIEPSTDPNAPHSYFCAVNGKGAEVQGPDGQVLEMQWVPVGVELTMKRMYVENLVKAKRDRVTTDHGTTQEANPHNKIVRHTSAVANVVIMHDPNPRGPAMFAELRRRNY